MDPNNTFASGDISGVTSRKDFSTPEQKIQIEPLFAPQPLNTPITPNSAPRNLDQAALKVNENHRSLSDAGSNKGGPTFIRSAGRTSSFDSGGDRKQSADQLAHTTSSNGYNYSANYTPEQTPTAGPASTPSSYKQFSQLAAPTPVSPRRVSTLAYGTNTPQHRRVQSDSRTKNSPMGMGNGGSGTHTAALGSGMMPSGMNNVTANSPGSIAYANTYSGNSGYGSPSQMPGAVRNDVNTGTPTSNATPNNLAQGIPGGSPRWRNQRTPSSSSSSRYRQINTSNPQQHTRSPSTNDSGHRRPIKRTCIGPWEFIKSIGAGSMGQVKLAMHQQTKQLAAVKIVPKAFTQRSKDRRESNETRDARVIREAAIGRLLDHPNIAKLYDVYSMTGHFYLVFEFVSGGQILDYIITHGCVKELQAVKFARSIASALDYCHHNSVVHRDLKIENILIADDGDIKLIDFGLSNLFRRDDLLRTFCGSLYFAAPELLNAVPYAGPEIDIWSFGVVLYVLVSGKVPFEDKSMSALHSKIKRGVVEYPQWLSSQCVDLLSKMLKVDSSARATLSEVMHHPWMMRGFNRPIDNHVPHRMPLRLEDINSRVIEEMEAVGLSDIDTVVRNLRTTLESKEYNLAVESWYYSQQQDLSSSPYMMGLDKDLNDPLDAFSPEISCYLLAQERVARLNMSNIRHPQHQQIVIPPPTPVVVPQLVSEPLRQSSPDSEPQEGIKMGRVRSKTIGSALEPPKIEIPQIPELSVTPAHAHGTYGMPTPLSTPNHTPNSTGSTLLVNRGSSESTRSAGSAGTGALGSGTLVSGSGSSSKPLSVQKQVSNDSRNVSTPLPQTPQRQVQYNSHVLRGTPQTAPAPQPMSLLRKLSFRRKPTSHARAKSSSYAVHDTPLVTELDSSMTASLNVPNSLQVPQSYATPVNKQTNLTPTDSSGSMPSIEYLKPVFFRGIFSVQSTSTKPLKDIRAEIIRVLNLLNIEYVEVRGGFACVYRLDKPEPRTPKQSLSSQPTTPSTPPRSPRQHRRIISDNGMLSPSFSMNLSGGSGDSIEMEIGASDMLNSSETRSSIPIRFEIDIVRVPILGLHGVQFKKMTGNMVHYKNLAQEILMNLRI